MKSIEWAEKTWNPITGCSPVSEGCKNCYAKRMANRLRGRYGYPQDEPFQVVLHSDKKLREPYSWIKPRRIFVCSMGDLFHGVVPVNWVYEIFEVMERCPQHTFMILTKRPERMESLVMGVVTRRETEHRKHIWLGITAENQKRWDERKFFLRISAAVLFVSIEPILGPINLGMSGIPGTLEADTPEWVIVGAETGPGKRPAKSEWIADIVRQCKEAGIPLFMKPNLEPYWNGELIQEWPDYRNAD